MFLSGNFLFFKIYWYMYNNIWKNNLFFCQDCSLTSTVVSLTLISFFSTILKHLLYIALYNSCKLCHIKNTEIADCTLFTNTLRYTVTWVNNTGKQLVVLESVTDDIVDRCLAENIASSNICEVVVRTKYRKQFCN